MKKKLTLAITGHRDMVETEEIRKSVSDYLENIMLHNLNVEIVLLSPLADGADRFVAKIFLELKKKYHNLKLIVPMPFTQERYMLDFNEESKKEFLDLLNVANSSFQIISKGDNPYQELGKYIVNVSDILLALWDGTYNGKAGGTGDVVAYSRGRAELIHFMSERQG